MTYMNMINSEVFQLKIVPKPHIGSTKFMYGEESLDYY